MTGFGRATATVAGQTLTVQLTSVNRKTLDLTLGVPSEWEALEPVVAERIRKVATRGKIHVTFELTGNEGSGPGWDDVAVEAAIDRLSALASKRGIPFHLTPDLLWQVAAAQRRGTSWPALSENETTILNALDQALSDFVQMRSREGATLLADFISRLDFIRARVDAIAERAPLVVPAYRELLMRRLREAQLELNVEDERVLKEVALFADRSDVTEEVTRLRSHLEQFDALLRSGGEIGRKSEFILQEISREVHTIGSKANDLTLSKHVIELKNELERVKEQIANVE